MSWQAFLEAKIVKKNEEKQVIDYSGISILDFANKYLSEYMECAPAPYHLIMYDILEKKEFNPKHKEALSEILNEESFFSKPNIKKIKGMICVEPREHAKTTRNSFIVPMKEALTKPKSFIILIASSQDRASGLLSNIRNEIRENPLIAKDFFPNGFKLNQNIQNNQSNQIKQKDTQKAMELPNGSIIQALGANGSLRGALHNGKRPTLVILDDIMKDDMAYSSSQRQKLETWFKTNVIPLSKDVLIFVVNTILHNEDLPSTLLRKIKNDDLVNWLGIKFSCYDKHGDPLWQSHWSKEDLNIKRKEMGETSFSREYLNVPANADSRLNKELIQWITPLDLSNITLREKSYIGVDPSAGAKGTDDSAFCIATLDNDKNIYIRETYGKVTSTDTFCKDMITSSFRHNVKEGIIESNGFQAEIAASIERTLKSMLDNKELPNDKYSIGLARLNATKSKVNRFDSVYYLLEQKRVYFVRNEGNIRLVEQAALFPNGSHDDLVDALVYVLMYLSKNWSYL